MSQMDSNNHGKQTELVKRGLINWIADHGLKEGDRIPTQTELRTNLQVGNAVIGRAIQALVEEGVLASLGGRRGFVVRDSVVDGYAGRTFGIICHQDTEFAIMSSLMQTLGMALTRRACHLHFFIKNDTMRGDSFDLSDFRGAERAVEHHQLDGLFSTVLLTDDAVGFCRAHSTPLCYVSVCNANGAGVAFGENLPEAMEYRNAIDRVDVAVKVLYADACPVEILRQVFRRALRERCDENAVSFGDDTLDLRHKVVYLVRERAHLDHRVE